MTPARKGRGGQTIPALRELQRLAGAAILRPLTPGWGTQPRWSDGRPMRAVAAGFIKPNDRLSSFERLEIYNRQYWFRVLDSLEEDFPGLRAVLGQRAFTRLCRAYLARYPSRSFTLRNLGDRLERFILEEPHRAGRRAALAAATARLEWAHVVAFDGPARTPIAAADLLGRDPARLRLALQPYITLLELDYGVDEFLLGLKRDQSGRRDASQAVDPRGPSTARTGLRMPRRERVCLAVHRLENAVFYKRLDPVAYRLLSALRDGKTLARACTLALESAPLNGGKGQAATPRDWAGELREWFKSWTEMGWFSTRP